jgi:hypothetical protein
MAGDKFLYNNAGTITEKAATVTSAGVGNAGNITALDSTGHLDNSVMPTGIGADTQAITASEALAAGDLVNIWNSTGAKARKADGSVAGKEAHGFVLAAVASAATATVYFTGTDTQVTGATPGVVFLSAATPGGFTSTAPSGTGQTIQRVGVATGTTTLNFKPGTPIVLA